MLTREVHANSSLTAAEREESDANLDVDLYDGYGWPRLRGIGRMTHHSRCQGKIVGAPQLAASLAATATRRASCGPTRCRVLVS